MSVDLTAAFKEGDVTFEQFAKTCMRNFGACVSQDGMPLNQPPKLQEPNIRVFVNGLKQAKKQREKAKKLTKEQLCYIAITGTQKQLAQYQNTIDAAQKLRSNYERVTREINNWVPPTTEHASLKNYMLSQIQEAINSECRVSTTVDELNIIKEKLVSFNPTKERERMIENAEYDIDYFEKCILDEQERVRVRNKWITDALESFKLPRVDNSLLKLGDSECKKECEPVAEDTCSPSEPAPAPINTTPDRRDDGRTIGGLTLTTSSNRGRSRAVNLTASAVEAGNAGESAAPRGRR